MSEKTKIIDAEKVVIRFSGDSGDGMQLAGTIFSNLSAVFGNEISTFPDYPAEIRAPQGTLGGVSGFQVHLGKNIYTPGDKCDVLVAMNPAALKTNSKYVKSNTVILFDEDSFTETDLKKADYKTLNPFEELGLKNVQLVGVPMETMVKSSLADMGMDNKAMLRSKNMFALGLICWLFNRPLEHAMDMLKNKFGKKPSVLEANIKVLTDGYNYGNNIHAGVSTYRIEKDDAQKGVYMDINGNKATAYGLIAASEKSGRPLFLGSYPITPATDILHELAKRKELGVKTVQAEDEIAGVCTAIGASFAGNLAATSTSGPGLALKSEAIGLAVMAEIPLVVIDVQRGGPSTGLPTKTEQTDLLQALYGRNGECPAVVVAASTPTDCFDMSFNACKIALEHMTPVILLTDAFIGNGSSAWRIPDISSYPEIKSPWVSEEIKDGWRPYKRNPENNVRYKAIPGMEGFMHRLGGLEKDYNTSAISTNPENHQIMTDTRQAKIDAIANDIPLLNVLGNPDSDTLVIGWGGTYGHIYSAVESLNNQNKAVAYVHFNYINPLPKNTQEILNKYPKIIVCELNNGQFASYLRSKVEGRMIHQFNRVQGQPFQVKDIEEAITKIMED
ncbi:MAG: 2-oxoacid:acceptor oxidoreductase subunit alpha [Bacteroidales bacterium]|nr:2-oxoacid:acceptor oxidoreductase subunit alpha [Bacteroidales bacterium]